jgi:hypothetical protein
LLSKKSFLLVFLLGVVLVVVFVRSGLFFSAGGSRNRENGGGVTPARSNILLRPTGAVLFYGKGRCGLCHIVGIERAGKCPSLNGAGSRLTTAFIYEAIVAPSAYVRLDFSLVEPKEYSARMPAVNRPPIGLTEKEMQAVIAFVREQK